MLLTWFIAGSGGECCTLFCAAQVDLCLQCKEEDCPLSALRSGTTLNVYVINTVDPCMFYFSVFQIVLDVLEADTCTSDLQYVDSNWTTSNSDDNLLTAGKGLNVLQFWLLITNLMLRNCWLSCLTEFQQFTLDCTCDVLM